jgi:hypothetical protein
MQPEVGGNKFKQITESCKQFINFELLSARDWVGSAPTTVSGMFL